MPWIAWAVVRTFGLDGVHPLTGAMAFTPYVAATAPLPLIAALALRSPIVSAVALGAALLLGAAILPRALEGPQPAAAAGGRTLVVMSSNMLVGSADAAAIVRLARSHRVDVLSLQELTPEAVKRLDGAGIHGLLPGRVLDPRAGASGSGLMARRALRQIGGDDSAHHAQPEAALALGGGGQLRVKVVHPIPPLSGASASTWRRELRGLPGPATGGVGGVARLLVGDFNATLDHGEFRRLLARGFHDAADVTGDGLRSTWPVGSARPPITIDHVLVPATVRVRRLSVHEIPGSDHRAVIAELVLPARGAT